MSTTVSAMSICECCREQGHTLSTCKNSRIDGVYYLIQQVYLEATSKVSCHETISRLISSTDLRAVCIRYASGKSCFPKKMCIDLMCDHLGNIHGCLEADVVLLSMTTASIDPVRKRSRSPPPPPPSPPPSPPLPPALTRVSGPILFPPVENLSSLIVPYRFPNRIIEFVPLPFNPLMVVECIQCSRIIYKCRSIQFQCSHLFCENCVYRLECVSRCLLCATYVTLIVINDVDIYNRFIGNY